MISNETEFIRGISGISPMLFEELSDISDYPNWLEIAPIELGRSGENKYHITRSNGTELILRTSDISNYKRHCDSARFAQLIHEKLGLNMNVPIEVAACCSDRLAYTLYTWVEGIDAEEKIPNLHVREQVRYGEKAGVLLKKIHSVEAPEDVMPWDKFYGFRIDKTLSFFSLLKLSFRGDKETISFIQNARRLLKDRPQTALHGDFRSGNLVLDKDGEYGVIDFDRWCWGDPYMDFQCIRRSCTASFSRGQILGYFEGDISGDFFELLALYSAVSGIGRICESYTMGRKPLDEAISAAERTVAEFNDFEGLVPTWY